MTTMKKTTLVTAFGPFGGRATNPSRTVMKALPRSIGWHRIVKAELPVSGRAVGRILRRLVMKHKPDLVVSMGLAAGETGIRIERFALNIQDYGMKDNTGYKPSGKKIRKDGPAAYCVSTNPVATATAVKKAGVPASVSNHAGTYVCNHTMYEAMSALEACGSRAKYAFIHLPLSTEEVLRERRNTASLPVASLRKGVIAAVKALQKQ